MEEKKEETSNTDNTDNTDIIMSDRMRQIAVCQKMMMHKHLGCGKARPGSAKTAIARIINSKRPKDKEL